MKRLIEQLASLEAEIKLLRETIQARRVYMKPPHIYFDLAGSIESEEKMWKPPSVDPAKWADRD